MASDDDKRRKHDESDDRDDRRKKLKSNKKKSRKKRKKHRKRYSSSSSDSSSSSSSSEDSSKRRRQRKKRKKKKEDDGPSFGKYGILKASDMTRMQRSFNIWLAEVKGISDFNGPKWELHKLFDDYREDFNTATLPHIKYYDYEKWEMEEYRAEQSKRSTKVASSSVLADEAAHQAKMKQQNAAKQKMEQSLLLSSMNRDKIRDMKRQADLRAQMQVAFKMGDTETYERLKEKLGPDD